MRGTPRSECPINAAVEVLGDPWAMLVLRDMVFGHRRYFRELQGGSLEGIASNILSDRLQRLVEAGSHGEEQTQHRGEGDRGRELPAAQLLEETRPHRRVASPSAASGRGSWLCSVPARHSGGRSTTAVLCTG